MICPNCGKEILDSAAFCTNCGANIAKMMAAAGAGADASAQGTSKPTPDSYDPHMYDDVMPHGQHLQGHESDVHLEQGRPGEQGPQDRPTMERPEGEQGSAQEQGYQQQNGPQQNGPQAGSSTGDNKPFLSVRAASLLCYWFSLIGWAVSYFLSDRNDPYLRFHLNQALVLALAALLFDFLGGIDHMATVAFVLGTARFVLWVIAFVRSCKGSTDPVPLLGGIHIIN
ncbi:MAG: zinc-ribbon domain-containing protein [Lachnospiraceae bacterium]|nr:zinc-ribbon domain-containing protein [Lachnospiraceae bacterium]